MHVLHQRCAGLDIHKKTVVAWVLITASDGQVQKQTRTCSTMTVELLALADWLESLAITHIAPESTGVLRILTPSRVMCKDTRILIWSMMGSM